MRLIDDIAAFLEKNGFRYSRQTHEGNEVLCASTPDGTQSRFILPLEIAAGTSGVIDIDGTYPLIITEDRWHSQKEMTRARLLAHLEVFRQAYARNCEVRRIDKATAQEFLDANHSYGYAACKYRYGMFLKRQTGHLAEGFPVKPGMTEVKPGTLIAVATFSNARKWMKGDKEIRSYEWTRYASLPDLRISGGMGKMLKAFIEDVGPDDIMSYADLEWSEGDVYKALGFRHEGTKDPVLFSVDTRTWTRTPVKPGTEVPESEEIVFFRNFGSNKYRLKLTDYE